MPVGRLINALVFDLIWFSIKIVEHAWRKSQVRHMHVSFIVTCTSGLFINVGKFARCETKTKKKVNFSFFTSWPMSLYSWIFLISTDQYPNIIHKNLFIYLSLDSDFWKFQFKNILNIIWKQVIIRTWFNIHTYLVN